ncbi:hypothetical protein [Sphingobium sp.]|uniref:hypothetical protein n=1 Tax=Sphingobium sp. TaxID=1912891 RepID=UPI003BB74D81
MSKTIRRAPTTRTYRAAVQSIIATVQREYKLNDSQLADRIGCAPNTVRNAKKAHANLDAVTLASIEHRFGPGAVDPFLALAGARATPLPDQLPRIDPILDIVGALHRLVEAQHAESEHGFLITSQELLAILRELRDARLAFDALILLAEPGLAAAPEAVQHWFKHFDHDAEAPDARRAKERPIPRNRKRPVPRDFVDVAALTGIDELMRRYTATRRTVERWLRETDEQIIDQLRNDH